MERMEVARTIHADPERIFALLTDPEGHVTIDSSGMLIDSTGDRPPRSATSSSSIWIARR